MPSRASTVRFRSAYILGMRTNTESARKILNGLASTQSQREELYKYFHQHPELSMQEHSTADRIIQELESSGISTHRVGGTGVVAIIENGAGPIVAMRADIDALPVKETSGKDYASTATQIDEKTGTEVPVAHACGHDFHLMSLLTALQAFNENLDQWSGTFIGPVLSSAFSVKVTVHGNGSHGSMPELSVDPVVLASTIVMRLQTIVSREVAATETAVVTVGAIQAGTKSNIIPDSAELLINTRAYNSAVTEHLKEAIERIVRAECVAARSPQDPQFTYYDRYPLTNNDGDATNTVREAFDAYFGEEVSDLDAVPASEDFSIIPDALGVPYTYWGLGGFADESSAVGNHNPAFAPDLQPTLDRGAEAIVVAACAWLAK